MGYVKPYKPCLTYGFFNMERLDNTAHFLDLEDLSLQCCIGNVLSFKTQEHGVV